jgi:S-DNA-T family DNA segregation ATPase FtsK/SpoIIIE
MLSYINDNEMYISVLTKAISVLIPLISIIGLFRLIAWLGTPYGTSHINENLWRVGLVNHAGETPLLIRKYKDKKNRNIVILEFISTFPLSEWERQQAKVETALNVNLIKVKHGRNKQRVLLYTISGSRYLPEILYWKDGYLSNKNFELVLGESQLGRETVNLAKIPHILLGGSTGSGKSVLLKLLIMQCIKKGATVYIADFKGGVDFGSWQRRCRIIIEENELLSTLGEIVAELESRKKLLRESECANIDAYNEATGNNLSRIIFACDEVAEVLDKTGLSKDPKKEIVIQIESKLSVIARQGRAFGIHLILATQRPDANILTGQIRNNIDFRVCGRADNVLSQIILDSTEAAEKIPKDAQGRFRHMRVRFFKGICSMRTRLLRGGR